jgi:hypothetical protein
MERGETMEGTSRFALTNQNQIQIKEIRKEIRDEKLIPIHQVIPSSRAMLLTF